MSKKSKSGKRVSKLRRGRRVVLRRMVSCDHYWCYEHCIWQAKQDDQNGVAVGRYCANCGKLETATADKWRPLPKSYVDMRQCLTKNLNVLRKTPSS